MSIDYITPWRQPSGRPPNVQPLARLYAGLVPEFGAAAAAVGVVDGALGAALVAEDAASIK
jgi:hypothetical protein